MEENSNVNPITGDPIAKDVNPITGDSIVNPRAKNLGYNRSMSISRTPGRGLNDNIESYREYGVTLSPYLDLAEERAKRQSTAEKWGHGLMKAGVTTVGAVADNTIGVLSGIGEAIYHGDATKLYNNQVGQVVDKVNNWMSENYANYYTEQERNAEGLASMGYANFWADKVTNGLGYAVGSIATVGMTGGMGLLGRGMSLGSKLYKGSKAIATGAKAADALTKSARMGRAMNAVRTAEIGMMMSYGESAVEAREVLNRATETLTQQRAEELGVHPSMLPASELEAIKDDAASVANTAFGLNMAVLSATNLLTFGKMLLPKYTQMRPGMKGIAKSSKTGKYVDLWKEDEVWSGIANRYINQSLLGGASEAFQEGTQFVIQESADSVLEKGNDNFLTDWTESIVEGYSNVYRDKEGKESMLLGAIIGMMMGGFGSVQQYANKTEIDENRAKLVNALNNPTFDNLLSNARSVEHALRASKRMQDALEQGDHKAYRDAQFELIQSQVALHHANGTLDLFLEKLDDAAIMEDAEFAKAFGIPDGVKFDKTEIVTGLKDKVKSYEKLKEKVDSAFPTMPKQGIDRLFMSKEEKQAEKERLQVEEAYKAQIMNHGMRLEDSDGRIDNLVEELNQMRREAGEVSDEQLLKASDFSIVGDVIHIEEIGEDSRLDIREGGQLSQEAVDKLNATYTSIQDPIKKVEALEKLRDLQRIARDRAISIKALEQLYASPESRDSYMRMQELKEDAEQRQKIDNDVRRRMSETNTYDELRDLEEALKAQPKPSKAVTDELNAELNKRILEEGALVKEYRKQSVEALELELEKESDPVKKAAIKKAIDLNKETGKEKGTEAAQEEAPVTEEKDETKEQAVKSAAERRAEREQKLKEQTEENKEKETEPVKADVTEEEREPGGIVTIAVGEARTAALNDGKNNYTIELDENGNRMPGRDSEQVVPINRAKTKEPGLEGKPVEFRVLPQTSSQVSGQSYTPVGAFIDGELIGVLSPADASKVLQDIQAGKNPTGTVERRFFKNKANTSRNGERVFRPATAVSSMEGFVGYGIVRNNEIFMVTDTEDAMAAKTTLDLNYSSGQYKFTPGQVVAVFKQPNGEYSPLPVSTQKIGESGAQRLQQMISENADLELIKQEFGIRFQASPDTNFIVEQTAEGNLIVSFQTPYGVTISYNSEEFTKMMNGQPAMFSVGEFVETENEEGDIDVTFEKKGDITPQQRAEIAATIQEEAAELMKNVRKQIDKNLLEYPEEVSRLEAEVMEVDFIAMEGNSPYFDVGIQISTETASVAESVQKATIPVEESKPTSVRKEQAAIPEATTTYSDDDLFGEAAPHQESAEAPDRETIPFANVILKSPLIKKKDGYEEEGYEGGFYIAVDRTGKIVRAGVKHPNTYYNRYEEVSPEILAQLQEELDAGRLNVGGTEYTLSPKKVEDLFGEPTEQTEDDLDVSKGDWTPLALRLGLAGQKAINTERARKFLQDRFGEDSVTIFEQLQTVGSAVVHGYVQNGAVHLWNNAEVGTEFHEAFHLLFRSNMTDAQREALYNDAVAQYGEPTAADIEAARRGQPEMSNEEARLLALEERMAEEFRDFMLNEEEIARTLPQRIAKFFKDILAYIKALIKDDVSINQAFSLLQNNRIPKRFSRNAESFSPGTAFMLKNYASNPQMHKEILDIAVYKVLKTMEVDSEVTIDMLIGTDAEGVTREGVAKRESEIRNWFLRNAFHKPGGLALEDREFADLKDAYDQGIPQAREVIQRLGLRPGAPLINQFGEPLPEKLAGNPTLAAHFRSVYDNWFDVQGELGGTKMRGFRSEVIDRLKPYGQRVTDPVEDADAEFERIYGISRMKEDPAKKLNEKTKRVLSRIPVSNTEGTFFGFQTYVPIMDVFTEIAGSVYNSPNIEEMLDRLDVRSKHIPYLRDVYNFVNNLSDQEKALFYSSMSMTMNEFRMVILDTDENGNRTVQIFNPGATSIESYYSDKWKTNSRGAKGIYSPTIEDGIPGVTIDQDKKRLAISGLETALSEPGAGAGPIQYNALANGLWALGIELGDTREQAKENVRLTFEGKGGKWQRFLSAEGANLRQMVEDIKSNKDIFTENSGRVREIAKTITANFVATPALSFVNGAGSVIFPLNQKTDLAITRELVESGEFADMMRGAYGHEAGNVRTLGTTLIMNDRYQKEFVPIDFDSLKSTWGDKTDIVEYGDLNFAQALAVSMNMFRNPSDPKMTYIALDTQADRSRLTFIPVPNWIAGLTAVDAKYGLKLGGSKGERIRKVLEDQIIVDLHRIAKGLGDPATIKGYHTNEQFRNLQTGGRLEEKDNAIAREAMLYAEQGGQMSPELRAYVDAEVDRVRKNVASYRAEVLEEFGASEQNLDPWIQWVKNNVPGVSNPSDFLNDFLISDMVGRMISRQIFRSGINYTKDGADYNKRSALTTTPGIVLMMRREGSDYGMQPTFNEITVQDVVESLPEEDLAAFRQKLLEQGVPEEDADRMLSAYRDIETTDAQAYISPSMYRSIRQGMGLWTEEDETNYKDYLTSGKWKGKIKPLKPSYEFRVRHNDHLVPVTHKNSYIVLTDELVEGIPALRQLLDRMEAKNKFAGLQRVDVVNVATAKKLGTFIPVDGRDEASLRTAPVMELDSRGLKFPQILPEAYKDRMTFGRQPRKNMVANINNNQMYTFNGQEISGRDLKALYQEALVAKLEINKQRIFKELGYDLVEQATTEVEKLKAIEQMLPKLRDKMKQLGVEKDYTQNLLDALELTKDENGNLTTKIPLSFPSIHSKLDQLLLGLFRTEVYQQNLTGQEMVQFAEFGPHEEDGSLQFYKLDGDNLIEAEVDIHPAVLERMGITPELPIEEINAQVQRLLGYRIPQQGKSSMLAMRIRRVLPQSAVSSVRVPTGITAMMGSDFDIDKLFVVFPEIEKGKRVQFDINNIEGMNEKQLNNIIIETFGAIATNAAHLSEILGGVEMTDINDARTAIGQGKPNIDINSPVQRIKTGIDNMLSGVLRGAYANAIAGRNVALATGVAFESSPGREMVVDGVTLGALVERSPFTNKYTDQYMSQYLTAAVDSVKDPLQAQINDNQVTADLTTYMLSMGMTPTQAVAFLNIPIIKEYVDMALEQDLPLRRILSKVEPTPIALKSEEMLRIVNGEQQQYNELLYLGMLSMMVEEAQSLSNLYKLLTPDAIDKAGTTAQHLALLDRKENLESGDTFGGSVALAQVTEGDAYPIVKAYYRAIDQSMEVGRRVGFIGSQPAVKEFKNRLKDLLGKRQFNEQQHRDINRAILHHLVTQPGSPLFESGLLDADIVEDMHLNGGIADLLDLVKGLNGATPNVILDSLEVVVEPLEDGRSYTYLRVDPSKIRTPLEKDMWTATFEGMRKQGGEAKALTDALVTNMMVTSGFAPGPYAAFDLIPVSLFNELGVTTHLNEQVKNLNAGNAYLDSFANEFMSSYGTHRIGKKSLVDNVVKMESSTFKYALKNGVEANKKNENDNYLIVAVGKDKYLFENRGGRFEYVNTKGRQYMFYEANLRDQRTGEKYNRSLINPNRSNPGNPSQSRLSSMPRETVVGAQAKIDRLTEAFANAGIAVTVEQGELPMGVKGQVEGNVITLDPSQMNEDTVYHEFGHILVDMLPEAEVKKYIQQVVKADPTLARTVAAKYPELEGLELGKEILVTAIGLEGAKLERKNPSKLQRLVNKILRALGKLFGVQPNAAAMLAEQMFGGEIKAERLTGAYNTKLQRSKDLRDELLTVTEDTLKSLKRQELRLKSLPESEKNRERMREIKTLERNILKVQKREDELNAFFDFADYAFERINKLQVLMETVKERAKDPNLSREEKFVLMNQIGEMRDTLDSLYNTREDLSTISKMRDLLRKTKFEGETEETADSVKRILSDLQDTLDAARDLNKDFGDVVIPVTADILLTYADGGINDKIDAEIERVRNTKDISGYGRFAILQFNPEHKQLRRQLMAKEITAEEFREKALELKIEDLKKKRVGREQLIQEMRDAHKSKGWFSHMMDPMVYSNEANLQLFSLAIKDAVNNATEKTRGFLYELEDQYSRLKAFRGSDFNEAEFNDAFLTTVTIDGVEQLSLVSQYDTQLFYTNLEAEKARLDAKYKVPEKREDYDDWKYDANGKLSKAYRDHRRDLIIWYKNNTQPVEGAEQKLQEMQIKISVLQEKIDLEERRDHKNIMITEIKELQQKLYESYSKTGVFMGDLARPKMFNEDGSRLYASEKYEKIKATPELKEYYDFVVERYAEAQKKIGNSQLHVNSWDTMSYIMPSIRKDRLAALQQEGWREMATEELRDFTKLDTDTQFGMMTEQDGERVKSIPRFYTNRIPARDVSRDIAASLAQFTHMANLFEEKAKTVGLVESMLSIHEQRKTIPVDSKTGLPIIDKVSEMARGVENDIVKEDPRNNRNYQHLKEFIDSVFYGQLDLEQGAILGVDMSKLAGKAAAFTAITNLAFNTLQVGNQFILDNLMGSEEAVAGQFFSKSDFAWAAATYAANKGALSDLGAFVPKSKLGQAMQLFDALNEVTDNMGKNVTGSKLKKAIQGDPFFALQHAVEHQSTATRMLALLRSYKGKLLDKDGNVILNEAGQEADLWDVLVKDKNGKYMIDPRVVNVDRNRVIAKLHGINKRANQIKGSHDRSMGNRRALGKLALLFRNYFVPGLRKRFGHGESYHVDYELGDVTRGMYQSLMGYLSLIPYEGVTAYQMMGETDKQNLRRVMYEAMATVTAMTIFHVLNAMLDDDEEDDNYLIAYSAYQARRLNSELLQFVNPAEFLRMAKSPMATLNWIEKYADVISQVAFKEPGYAVGIVGEEDIFYQRRTGTAEKGDRKVLAQFKKIIPVLNGYQTSFLRDGSAAAVEEKLRWFN